MPFVPDTVSFAETDERGMRGLDKRSATHL